MSSVRVNSHMRNSNGQRVFVRAHIRKTMQPSMYKGKQPKKAIAEIKHDGTRVLIYKDGKEIKMINRRNTDITDRFPEFNDLYKQIRPRQTIIDSEVIVKDKDSPYGDFKKLSMREHLKNKEEIRKRAKSLPAKIIAFDILNVNNKDISQLPLIQRKRLLNEAIPENAGDISEIPYSLDIKKTEEKAKKANAEGIVIKDLESPYEEKKSSSWIKKKKINMADLTLLGYTAGTGKRQGLFGALITGYPKGDKWILAGKVGTGFTEQSLKDLKREMDKNKTDKPYFHTTEKVTWLKPQMVGRFKFLRLTHQKIMREPRFVSPRNDILPKQTHLE